MQTSPPSDASCVRAGCFGDKNKQYPHKTYIYPQSELDEGLIKTLTGAADMQVVVATHGHCFDGLASAVIFTWIMKRLRGEQARFKYRACGYGPDQSQATPRTFDGDENALLDYRFCPSAQLQWYFDHHRTAFGCPEDRAYFDAHQNTREFVFDSDYTSCAKLLFDSATTRYGLDPAELSELARWADTVDSARFESAEAAIDRSHPVMRLVSVTEQHGDDAFLEALCAELMTRDVSEVAASPRISRLFASIGKNQEDYRRAVSQHARPDGRVVLVDLTERPLALLGKFVTYALYPEAMFSVVAARVGKGYKISVGYNPWCGKPLDCDISAICARYGGGGHRVVGGISLPDGQGDSARHIARTIASELCGGD